MLYQSHNELIGGVSLQLHVGRGSNTTTSKRR